MQMAVTDMIMFFNVALLIIFAFGIWGPSGLLGSTGASLTANVRHHVSMLLALIVCLAMALLGVPKLNVEIWFCAIFIRWAWVAYKHKM
jgi:hypothetical protein